MRELFASGHIADLILIIIALEGVALMTVARSLITARDVISMLLPGACLVIALRAALTDVEWPWIAMVLAFAFVAHLVDVMRRVRARS